MRDKKGFTLTELLAVIVLIGVILAIAVPSYQSYVTRTRKEVLESYKANIIDAANQYAAKCFQENKLGECKENEKIWDEIKTNLKNGDDIAKEYEVTVEIDNGPSNVSDLYSISLVMKKRSSNEETRVDTAVNNTSDSTDNKTTSRISINGTALTQNNTIEGIFPAKPTLSITGNVQEVTLKEIKSSCKLETNLFSSTTKCNLNLENGENKIKITYKDGNKEEITINADTINPKIETSNINTSPTNKVEFTVTITDENLEEVTQFPNKECKIEEDKEKNKKYACAITENGEYSFSAIDKAGNTVTKYITISNITSEKPSVILNIDNEAVSKSKSIEIEYVSGSNGNDIGFNTDQKLKWKLINTSNNKEEKTVEIPNLSNRGSQKVEINGLTGTYRFIVEGLTNKAGNKNNDEERTIHLDNTPPSAVVVTAPNKEECNNKNRVCEAKCENPDSNGNRACTVEFYGGAVGTPVKAEVNFVVEDVGSSGVGKAYYRTTTTGNFTETTIEAINSLEHKDYLGNKMNLYIEVVFADALGNIDYTKNITKITFIKHKL